MPGQNYEVIYEESFYRSLVRLGIPFHIFDSLVKHSFDTFLGNDPYDEATGEVAGTGHRHFPTDDTFPDLPKMAVAYRVEDLTREVFVTGAVSASKKDDYPDFS